MGGRSKGEGSSLAWKEGLRGVGSPIYRSDLFPYGSLGKVDFRYRNEFPGRISPRLTPFFTPLACTLITQENVEFS